MEVDGLREKNQTASYLQGCFEMMRTKNYFYSKVANNFECIQISKSNIGHPGTFHLLFFEYSLFN